MEGEKTRSYIHHNRTCEIGEASEKTQGSAVWPKQPKNRSASHSNYSLDDVRVLEIPEQRDLP
jgi:hypothetical protein